MIVDARLETLATRIGADFTRRFLSVSTAESCTGGFIAKVLTDIPGSSAWFSEGVVTYSNESKTRLLGVSPATLARYGAVSEQVVRQMAVGALRRSGAGVAVAVTGIAGPSGGSPDKPVGTVWLAWAVRAGRRQLVEVTLRRFRGDRDSVRRKTVLCALRGLQQVTRKRSLNRTSSL